MEKFHSEHSFEINKTKFEINRTFSETAFSTLLSAITGFIGNEVGKHWACKSLSIKIVIDGTYNPEEKNSQN